MSRKDSECQHGSYILHGARWICDRCGRVPFEPHYPGIDPDPLETLAEAKRMAPELKRRAEQGEL